MTDTNERMSDEQIEWLPVAGFDGYYKVSNAGDILSVQRTVMRSNGYPQRVDERLLSQSTDKYGYSVVKIWKNKNLTNKKVHQIVAQAFVPNPDGKPQVNHKDGNKKNNHAKNLEWCTQAENTSHAYESGLARMEGEYNHRSKLTTLAVRVILKLCDMGGMTRREIGSVFGVSQSSVSNIASGHSWKEVHR